MLEWENASPSPKKKYRGLESDEDKKMWRNRYVLPSPSYVEGFSNSIVATTNNQTPNQSSRTPQEEKEAITRSLQHYQQAIESLTGGSKELKELAKAIVKKFKDKKDLGQSLAKQLLEKLGPNGLNIESTVAKEDWYSKIKLMAK